MDVQRIFKMPVAVMTVVALSAAIVAACGGGGGSSVSGGNASCAQQYGGGGGSGGSGACSPSPTPAPAAQVVGLLLTGEDAVTTTSDGTVLGYFNGVNGHTPNGSGVVNLTANMPVQFHNVEAAGGFGPHTASLLGAYSGSYPGSFSNTNGATPSAAGASISSPNFSSGQINPGAVSAEYNSGGPGMFVFGCAFHYLSNNMRTVVIVH